MTRFYDPNLQALDEIEDLLEAYADVRLAPPGPVLARMRTAVLAQAATSAATQRRLAEDRASKRSRWILPRLQLPRRAFALGMAATFTMATGAAVMAAPAGSPFFNARIVLETAFLPNQVDARLASHEQHLDQRLAEADAAAARGDVVALEAALAAYRAEVDSVVGDTTDDLDKLAHLEAVLAKHVATLEALAARLPNQTASGNAVEHAIDTSEKAVTKLKDKGKANGGGGGGGGGAPTDKPARPTDKPDRTPPTQPDRTSPNRPGRQ
jgi:hypothetical protein